jgi:putative ABC transport system permease protein
MLAQIIAVTGVNIRTIRERWSSSLVAMTGICGVVVVFIGVLSIAEGFKKAMADTGDPQTVIVMRSGSDTEMNSIIEGDATRIIGDAPGIVKGKTGPAASAELFVIVNHPLTSTGTDANVPLRGVSAAALDVRPEVKIIEGRMFEQGRNEIIVGRAAVRQFANLDVGSSVRWGENTWQVVGVFEADGSVSESEIWCDAKVLQPAYRRGNTYQSVYARLESADGFQSYKDTLTSDPRLNVSVVRVPDYYSGQSLMLRTVVSLMGMTIAGLMGIGAIFAAINTMYMAVASRTREIATLRALGYGSAAVVFSVLAEAVFLSLVGGMVGAAIAWLAFDGFQTATMNWQSFSQVAFAFAVTPSLLAQALGYAVVMGLLGGLFPAWRAARLPVVTALRQL